MANEQDNAPSIRDIIDSQLETHDHIRIGRVADIEAAWLEDGTLVLTALVTGPQALAGRVGTSLRPLARFIFRDHFEHQIPLSDIENFGPTLHLRRNATEYRIGQSDRWIANHILRWIPGSGYHAR
jgi:hypothetical protein